MTKTRRGSRNKRKTTRRLRQHKKGGAPKVDPTSKKSKSEKKEKVKIMAQPPHDSPAAYIQLSQLSFTPAARDSLIVRGARADHMMRHLGIQTPNIHHHDPLSATQATLESATARVMVNTMIESIHASVDRLRARGDFANAVVQLDRALELGSIRARVELADILYDGRVGPISSADEDTDRARALLNVDDPVVMNNPDYMGLQAFFELEDMRRGDDLVCLCNKAVISARRANSSRANSKYGMFALGTCLLSYKRIAFARRHGHLDSAAAQRPHAVQYFEISANANYDRAQDALGSVWFTSAEEQEQEQPNSAEAGRDRDKAFRLFTSAANQGLRAAMNHLGDFYRAEAERLRPTASVADLRRMIFAARQWYYRSNYSHEREFDDLKRLRMSLDVGNEETEDDEDEETEDDEDEETEDDEDEDA
jgi:TPR repeat protein